MLSIGLDAPSNHQILCINAFSWAPLSSLHYFCVQFTFPSARLFQLNYFALYYEAYPTMLKPQFSSYLLGWPYCIGEDVFNSSYPLHIYGPAYLRKLQAILAF